MTARSRFFRAELWETSYFLRTGLRVVASAKQAKYKGTDVGDFPSTTDIKTEGALGTTYDVRRASCLESSIVPYPLLVIEWWELGLFFSRVRRISGKLDTLKNVAAKKERNKVSVQIKTTGFVVLFITWPPPSSAIKAFRRFLEKEVRRRICVPGGLCCAMTNDDQANFDDERNISSSISFTISEYILQYVDYILTSISIIIQSCSASIEYEIREWFEDSDAIRYIYISFSSRNVIFYFK